MSESSINLTVNGKPRSVRADGNMPLLYLLRHELELKGTRFGCGVNQCGACHVLLEGRSVPACDTPLWAVQDKQVTTVEGLAQGAVLHPLQQAFLDEQAAQCGYCISGILVSSAALLQQNPGPDEAQVRAALDPHLCRCGSHNRIVRAVLRAAQVMKATT